MSSTLGVGVPVPKMLPITGTWTLPFTAYLIYLSNRVCFDRVQKEKYLGTEGDNELLVKTRSQANFLEYVPFCFSLAAIAELNGADRTILNYAMGALLALRIMHVELGMNGEDTTGVGRPIGFFGTQGFLAAMAGYSTWLVKGYWGF